MAGSGSGLASRRDKLLLTCKLPLPSQLRARVWTFLSSSSSWWPTIVLPDDLDTGVTAKDGDRVLICGRCEVDTDLLQIGVVSRERLSLSPEMVLVCRKQVILRGQTPASELAFSTLLHGSSQCIVLAGNGGKIQSLRVTGVQRCALEIFAGEWHISDCVVRAPPKKTWDAFTASGGSTTFWRCRLIGNHGVGTLYPVDGSGSDTQESTQTCVRLERCVIQDGKFCGIAVLQDTSLDAVNCVFLRNGCGASQRHIERFAVLACPKLLASNKLMVADFLAPVNAGEFHSPASQGVEEDLNLGCVLQLFLRSRIKIVNCQFGANGMLIHNEWQGAWYTWRADAPYIVAAGNVTADGQPVEIANVMYENYRRRLDMCEAQRDEREEGLAAWGVSKEEQEQILHRERGRTQPPWLQA